MTPFTTENSKNITHEIDTPSVSEFQEGVNHVALGLILFAAGLVGVWGLVCLISGLAMSGNIFDIALGWFRAIVGM